MNISIVTVLIILATVAISIPAFNKRETMYKLLFDPAQVYHRKQYYRLVSHGFVHADWGHLLFNMISLFFFGPIVERYFGNPLLFLLFYLMGIVVASLISLFRHKDDYYFNSLGASGGVSAVVFASILFDPLNSIIIIPIPIPIPGVIFGVLYLWYSNYMSKKNTDNINHDAHFLGAVYGFTLPILFDPSLFMRFINQIISYIS